MTKTTPVSSSGCGCPESRAYGVSRRRLLQGATAAGLGLAGTSMFGEAFRQVAYGAAPGSHANVVVVLSLRGGADGLSLVVPRGRDHDNLAGYRPATVVPEASLLGDDPRFGLHPSFAPLMGMWGSGQFGAVHAVGQPVPNRSHFDSIVQIEDANPGSSDRVGWINRMVGLDPTATPGTAVQLGSAMLPTSMVGPAEALGANNLSDLNLGMLFDKPDELRRRSVRQIWAKDASAIGATVRSAVQVADTFGPLANAAHDTRTGTVNTSAYPDGDLGRALANTAALVKADLGSTMITLDYGPWDMHAGMVNGDQDPTTGWMHAQVDLFARSLAAFFADLGQAASRVTVVTISEFGRRVQENGDRGVDHGYANAMLMLGAGVNGGTVHGRWPGLAPANLTDGDLSLGQDYRSVLWEVIQSRFPNLSGQRSQIFPGFNPENVGSMA